MLARIALQWESERRPKRCTAGRKTLRCLHTLGFADDTTMIFPAPKFASVREQVKKVLGDWGETVHPEKDEFTTTGMYRPHETLPAGHQHHVRMLGAWIDTDGGTRMDNHAEQSRGQGVVQTAGAVGQLRPASEGARPCVSVGGLGQSLVRVRSESVVERRLDQNPCVCEQTHQVPVQANDGDSLANDQFVRLDWG